MDFSSNLRTYSNILAKIITSQTPNGQCFYCKKKMGNAFIVKKRKKKERESENPPNECCWISNLLNRYTCGKPKCWLLVHFTWFNMIHVLMNPSYNLSDLVLSLIVIEKMQLLLSA